MGDLEPVVIPSLGHLGAVFLPKETKAEEGSILHDALIELNRNLGSIGLVDKKLLNRVVPMLERVDTVRNRGDVDLLLVDSIDARPTHEDHFIEFPHGAKVDRVSYVHRRQRMGAEPVSRDRIDTLVGDGVERLESDLPRPVILHLNMLQGGINPFRKLGGLQP